MTFNFRTSGSTQKLHHYQSNLRFTTSGLPRRFQFRFKPGIPYGSLGRDAVTRQYYGPKSSTFGQRIATRSCLISQSLLFQFKRKKSQCQGRRIHFENGRQTSRCVFYVFCFRYFLQIAQCTKKVYTFIWYLNVSQEDQESNIYFLHGQNAKYQILTYILLSE